jgi:hypothetical protein
MSGSSGLGGESRHREPPAFYYIVRYNLGYNSTQETHRPNFPSIRIFLST